MPDLSGFSRQEGRVGADKYSDQNVVLSELSGRALLYFYERQNFFFAYITHLFWKCLNLFFWLYILLEHDNCSFSRIPLLFYSSTENDVLD